MNLLKESIGEVLFFFFIQVCSCWVSLGWESLDICVVEREMWRRCSLFSTKQSARSSSGNPIIRCEWGWIRLPGKRWDIHWWMYNWYIWDEEWGPPKPSKTLMYIGYRWPDDFYSPLAREDQWSGFLESLNFFTIFCFLRNPISFKHWEQVNMT